MYFRKYTIYLIAKDPNTKTLQLRAGLALSAACKGNPKRIRRMQYQIPFRKRSENV